MKTQVIKVTCSQISEYSIENTGPCSTISFPEVSEWDPGAKMLRGVAEWATSPPRNKQNQRMSWLLLLHVSNELLAIGEKNNINLKFEHK